MALLLRSDTYTYYIVLQTGTIVNSTNIQFPAHFPSHFWNRIAPAVWDRGGMCSICLFSGMQRDCYDLRIVEQPHGNDGIAKSAADDHGGIVLRKDAFCIGRKESLIRHLRLIFSAFAY